MPSSSTIRRWRVEIPGFQSIYARAREDQGETQGMRVVEIADRMREIVGQLEKGKITPEVARAMIDALKGEADNRKWSAARMSRAIFGDRVDHELSGPGGGPMEIILSRPEESNLA
jgi:hypothetical protein